MASGPELPNTELPPPILIIPDFGASCVYQMTKSDGMVSRVWPRSQTQLANELALKYLLTNPRYVQDGFVRRNYDGDSVVFVPQDHYGLAALNTELSYSATPDRMVEKKSACWRLALRLQSLGFLPGSSLFGFPWPFWCAPDAPLLVALLKQRIMSIAAYTGRAVHVVSHGAGGYLMKALFTSSAQEGTTNTLPVASWTAVACPFAGLGSDWMVACLGGGGDYNMREDHSHRLLTPLSASVAGLCCSNWPSAPYLLPFLSDLPQTKAVPQDVFSASQLLFNPPYLRIRHSCQFVTLSMDPLIVSTVSLHVRSDSIDNSAGEGDASESGDVNDLTYQDVTAAKRVLISVKQTFVSSKRRDLSAAGHYSLESLLTSDPAPLEPQSEPMAEYRRPYLNIDMDSHPQSFVRNGRSIVDQALSVFTANTDSSKYEASFKTNSRQEVQLKYCSEYFDRARKFHSTPMTIPEGVKFAIAYGTGKKTAIQTMAHMKSRVPITSLTPLELQHLFCNHGIHIWGDGDHMVSTVSATAVSRDADEEYSTVVGHEHLLYEDGFVEFLIKKVVGLANIDQYKKDDVMAMVKAQTKPYERCVSAQWSMGFIRPVPTVSELEAKLRELSERGVPASQYSAPQVPIPGRPIDWSRTPAPPQLHGALIFVPGVGGSIIRYSTPTTTLASLWPRITHNDTLIPAHFWGVFASDGSGAWVPFDKNTTLTVPQDNYGFYATDTLAVDYPKPLSNVTLYTGAMSAHFMRLGHVSGVDMFAVSYNWMGNVMGGVLHSAMSSRICQASLGVGPDMCSFMQSLDGASGDLTRTLPRPKVTVIGHSLGCLFTRCFLAHNTQYIPYISDFVALGPPFAGASAYLQQAVLQGYNLRMLSTLFPWDAFRPLQSQGSFLMLNSPVEMTIPMQIYIRESANEWSRYDMFGKDITGLVQDPSSAVPPLLRSIPDGVDSFKWLSPAEGTGEPYVMTVQDHSVLMIPSQSHELQQQGPLGELPGIGSESVVPEEYSAGTRDPVDEEESVEDMPYEQYRHDGAPIYQIVPQFVCGKPILTIDPVKVQSDALLAAYGTSSVLTNPLEYKSGRFFQMFTPHQQQTHYHRPTPDNAPWLLHPAAEASPMQGSPVVKYKGHLFDLWQDMVASEMAHMKDPEAAAASLARVTDQGAPILDPGTHMTDLELGANEQPLVTPTQEPGNDEEISEQSGIQSQAYQLDTAMEATAGSVAQLNRKLSPLVKHGLRPDLWRVALEDKELVRRLETIVPTDGSFHFTLVVGSNIETPCHLVYNTPVSDIRDLSKQKPYYVPISGDGTVSVVSAQVHHFPPQISAMFDIPGATHMNMMQDPRTMAILDAVVGYKSSV